jgi:cytochrome c peroxidase
VPRRAELPSDEGRLTGASTVLKDEFNCRSRWSDSPQKCAELEFLVTGDHTLERAYRVPSLRNVARRAPYMDAGQFATLAEVLDHYNRAPAAPAGHTELKPLRLKAIGSLPQCAERPDCRESVAALAVDVVSKSVDLVIVAGDSSAISRVHITLQKSSSASATMMPAGPRM